MAELFWRIQKRYVTFSIFFHTPSCPQTCLTEHLPSRRTIAKLDRYQCHSTIAMLDRHMSFVLWTVLLTCKQFLVSHFYSVVLRHIFVNCICPFMPQRREGGKPLILLLCNQFYTKSVESPPSPTLGWKLCQHLFLIFTHVWNTHRTSGILYANLLDTFVSPPIIEKWLTTNITYMHTCSR